MRFLARVVAVVLVIGVVGLAVVEEPTGVGHTARPTTTTSTATSAPPPSPTTAAPAGATTATTARPGPRHVVRGRVVDVSGRPVRGVQVALHPRYEGLAGGLQAITMGMGGCLGTPTPVDCRLGSAATTGAGGRFELVADASSAELAGADLELTATARDGSWVRRRWSPSAGTADLVLWEAGATYRDGIVRWQPLEAVPGVTYQVQYRVQPVVGLEDWFTGRTAETAFSLDPRLFEDGTGVVVVSATHADAVWSSAEAALRGPGAPPSRDRPCTVHAADAAVPPRSFPRCPLTDADTHSRVPADADGVRVVVDLGASRPVSMVVLGYNGSFVVEVSEDGQAWAELMRGDHCTGPFQRCVAQPPQPRSARYVRLSLEQPWDAWFVDSLAIW